MEELLRRACCSRIAMVLLMAGLVGCGGGGGTAGEGSAPTAAPPPPPTSSGLVPVAGTPGAVFEADATSLRVLRPGATWNYVGIDHPDGLSGIPQNYNSTVSHTASALGVTETSTDGLHLGTDSVSVQAAGGAVSSPIEVQPVPNVPADHLDAVELRSPVRIGDQYTLYDRRFDNAGVDLDGDRINEALDIAVWTRVAASEVIDLPQRRGVKTVRVDTTVAQRVRFSSTGSYSAVEQTIQKVWYAKGIGVVQIELDQPHESVAGLRHLTRERLDSWDGLTEGLGALAQQAAVAPGDAAAGRMLSSPIDAAGFADHAVALTQIPGAVAVEGIALTSIDGRGRVISSTDHRGQWVTRPRLLRLGSDLRVLGVTDSGIVATGFDAHGQTLTQGTRVLVPDADGVWNAADGDWFRAEVAGNKLWLLTLQGCAPYGDSTMLCNLVLQAFDAAGQVVVAPQVLARGVAPNAVMQMRLAGDSDRVVATWRAVGPQLTWHFAVADAQSGAVMRVGDRADLGAAEFLQPAAPGPGLALVYPSNATFGGLAAVALDAGFEPIRGTSGALSQELVSQPWMEPASLAASAAAGGKLWFATSFTTGGLEMVLSELNWPAGAAASTGSLQLLGRFPYLSSIQLVPLADRMLIIGGRGSDRALATTVVWRTP